MAIHSCSRRPILSGNGSILPGLKKTFCRKADHITVPIEDAKEAYYPEFRHKIKMIPQGYDFNEVPIDHNLYRKNPVPPFAYAGAFIPGVLGIRKNFLEYLLTLKCPFLFIIYTNQTSIVIPYAERSEGRIEIRPYVPRAELLPVLAGMDFLVNIGNGTNIQSPSKLIDYQICGRPVLSVDSFSLNSSVITQFCQVIIQDRLAWVICRPMTLKCFKAIFTTYPMMNDPECSPKP